VYSITWSDARLTSLAGGRTETLRSVRDLPVMTHSYPSARSFLGAVSRPVPSPCLPDAFCPVSNQRAKHTLKDIKDYENGRR
jgi:hypothetical protein